MKRVAAIIGLIGFVCLILITFWSVTRRPGDEETNQPAGSSEDVSGGDRVLGPRRLLPGSGGDHGPRDDPADHTAPRPVNRRVVEEVPLPALVPPEDLKEVFSIYGLPDDADHYAGKRVISNHTVTQGRVRFVRDDGSIMDVEVTDMGSAPPPDLLTALGFNPEQADEATDSGFVLRMDADGRLGNWEYDHETKTGMFQMVVANRFMVEVRLEEVGAQAFRQFFHDGLIISELQSLADLNP